MKKIVLIVLFLLFISIGCVSANPDQNNPTNDNTTYNTIDTISSIDYNNNQNLLLSSQSNDLNIDNSNIHFIHEGIKFYELNDEYKIKLVDKNNKPITCGEVSFFIDDIAFWRSSVNNNGIASCLLPTYGNLSIMSYYSNPNSNYNSYDFEDITVGHPTIASLDKSTWGANFKSNWSNMTYETYNDGYHGFIDNNTYHWITFNGERYIVHREKIIDETTLLNFFKTITNTNKWDIIEINLINTAYNLKSKVISDKEWDYIASLTYGQLIIHGNGATLCSNGDYNFMYIGSNSNVILKNLTLKNFNHCFINNGYILCDSVIFKDNCAYKLDVGINAAGAVIHNYNTAEFHNCDFINNDAKFFGFGKQHMEGSILLAEPYSTTHFYHSKHTGNSISKDCIYARKYSSIIFTPIDKAGESRWTWDYFVCESFYHPLATITMVRSDETIMKDYYNNTYNPYVFNCSNSKELHNALSLINNAGVKGSEVIINLINTKYEYTIDTYFSEDWQKVYDGDFFTNWNDDPDRDFIPNNRYLLNTGGLIPITINGNGAHIRFTNNKADNDVHFAFIGKNGILTLNNLTLTSFNTAFINSQGTLICNNCDFHENKIEHKYQDYGGVLRSYHGSNIFINCTMMNNRGCDGTDFAFIDESYLEIDNCILSQHYPTYALIGKSIIKCPLDLYKNHFMAHASLFISDNPEEEVHYIINSAEDFNKILNRETFAGMTIIDFNCSCSVDLNKGIWYPSTFYVRSNGFDIKVTSNIDISRYSSVILDGFNFDNICFNNCGMLTLINCNIKNCNSNCMFTNEGECSLTNCTIFANKCKNVFENIGKLNFINSTIINNDANEYGIIYNNGGSISCAHSTFSNNGATDLYNFRTLDYSIINCNNINIKNEQPMSNLELDLIKAGIHTGVVICSFGFGTLIGATLGYTISGVIVSSIGSFIIGGAGGYIYGNIEANTYHDYSHTWDYVIPFAISGLSAGTVGFYFGVTKFNSPVEGPGGQDAGGNGQDAGGNGHGAGGNGHGAIAPGEPGAPDGANPGNTNFNQAIQLITEPISTTSPKINTNNMAISDLSNGIANFFNMINELPTYYHNIFLSYSDTFIRYHNNQNTNINDWLNLFCAIDMTYLSIQQLINNNIINPQNNHINPNPQENPENQENQDNNQNFNNNNLYTLTHNTYFGSMVRQNNDPHFNNITHINRVVNLLNNFHNLYNLVNRPNVLNSVPESLRSTVFAFHRFLEYNPTGINSMLNDRHTINIRHWETFYNNAIQEWQFTKLHNEIIRILLNDLHTDLESRYNELIKSIKTDTVKEWTELMGDTPKQYQEYLNYEQSLLNSLTSQVNINTQWINSLFTKYNELIQTINEIGDSYVNGKQIIIAKSTAGLNRASVMNLIKNAKVDAENYLNKHMNNIKNEDKVVFLSNIYSLYAHASLASDDELPSVYSNFVDRLNKMLTSECISSTRMVDIKFDKNANIYESIFNVPKWFNQSTSADKSCEVLYKDLLVLKLINPYLYQEVLCSISKDLTFNKDSVVHEYLKTLNCDNLINIYMYIFARLAMFRDNVNVSSHESSVIFDAIKYKSDAILLKDCFKVLSKEDQVKIARYLIEESNIMISDYEGQLDVYSNYKEIRYIDANNISEDDFNKLTSFYYDLWAVNLNNNCLDRVNPNTLSNEALGELLINHMTNIWLISGADPRVDHKLYSVKIANEKFYLSYASAKILYLVQQDSKESRAQLIKMFNEIKTAYDYVIVGPLMMDILAQNSGSINFDGYPDPKITKLDIDYLLKFPSQYSLIVSNMFKSGLDTFDFKYKQYEKYHHSLDYLQYVPTKEVVELLLSVYNYGIDHIDNLADDMLVNYFKMEYDKFQKKINSKPNAEAYNQFLDIISILHNSEHQNNLKDYMYIWNHLDEKYPAITNLIKRDIVKGNIVDFLKENQFKDFTEWIENYLIKYFKINVDDGKNYNIIIHKESTFALSKQQIVEIAKNAWHTAQDYCNSISKNNPPLGTILLNKVNNLYYNLVDNVFLKGTLEQHQTGYSDFIDKLNELLGDSLNSKYNGPLREVNISLSDFSNIYEGIFNLPSVFKQISSSNNWKIVYDDLLLLKLYNPDLYNKVSMSYFKNINSNNQLYEYIASLNPDDLHSLYDNVFNMLGSYRNNTKVISEESSVIIKEIYHDKRFKNMFISTDSDFKIIADIFPKISSNLFKICGEMLKDYNGNEFKRLNRTYNSLINIDFNNINEMQFGSLTSLYFMLWFSNNVNNYLNMDPNMLNISELGDLIIKAKAKFFLVFDRIITSSTGYDSWDYNLNYDGYYVSYLVHQNTPDSKQKLIDMFNDLKKDYDMCIFINDIYYRTENSLEIYQDVFKYSGQAYYASLSTLLKGVTMKLCESKGLILTPKGIKAMNTMAKYSRTTLSPITLYCVFNFYNYMVSHSANEIINYFSNFNIDKLNLPDKYFDMKPIRFPKEISVDVNKINVKQFIIKDYDVQYIFDGGLINDSMVLLDFKFNKKYNTYVALMGENVIVSKEYYASIQGEIFPYGPISGDYLMKPLNVVYNADGKRILAKDFKYVSFTYRYSVDDYGRPFYIKLKDVPKTVFVPGKLYYYHNGTLVPAKNVIVTEDGFVEDINGNNLYSNRIGDKYAVNAKYYTFNGKLVESKDLYVDSDGYVVDCNGNLLFKEFTYDDEDNPEIPIDNPVVDAEDFEFNDLAVQNMFKDIEDIMKSEEYMANVIDNGNIEGYEYLLGAYQEIEKKYSDITIYLDNILFNRISFVNYVKFCGNVDIARNNIIKVIKYYLKINKDFKNQIIDANNPNVGDIKLDENKYNQIKDILENKFTKIETKSKLAGYDSLVGSWDTFTVKFPDIAIHVMNNLLNGNLEKYAQNHGCENTIKAILNYLNDKQVAI